MNMDHRLWYLEMRKPVEMEGPVKTFENKILHLLKVNGDSVSFVSCQRGFLKTTLMKAIENLYIKFAIDFENGLIIKGKLFDKYIKDLPEVSFIYENH